MTLKIAIVGRPNVGKSTLFNRLLGKKTAIVHDKPGVTRDRRMAKAKFYDLDIEIIDTPGFEIAKEGSVEKAMFSQTQIAIDEADVCIFMMDARTGLHPFDLEFAKIVRHAKKPALLLANKCEGKSQEDAAYEAYKLGLGTPICFSAEHGLGLAELYAQLQQIIEKTKLNTEAEAEEKSNAKNTITVALVGRPNVGKSTLTNALLGKNRMLTGPQAGITRDAISSKWEYNGQQFNLVDTAGLRKHARVEDSLEKLSVANTKRAAFLAQVVILVLDADMVLDKQDLTIARQVLDEGRALVIAVNKWDVADKQATINKLNDKLMSSLNQAEGIETVTVSALKKHGLKNLMDAVVKTYNRWNTRIPTAPLNKWFEDMKENCPPPLGKNKRRIKLRYITQAKSRPPAFYIFSSNPEGLPDTYLRYLTHNLRETFDLWGIPIRMVVRKGENPYKDKK